MSQTTVLNSTACQTITALASNHTINGNQVRAVNGGSSPTNELLPAKSTARCVSTELFINGIGCAVASATVGPLLQLQPADGLRVRAGFSLVIAAEDPTPALTALTHMVAPLKNEQIRRHRALATLDREIHQQQLDQARADSLAYQESDSLPDPTHLEYYDQEITGLENRLKPMMLLENPSPGRLTLAIGKSADANLLAVYDDLHFKALLNALRNSRGHLDFELLAKSSRGEIFDGGFLEGVNQAAIPFPAVSAVIIAAPETVATLLMAEEPQVAAFAETCLILNEPGRELADAEIPGMAGQIRVWQEAVSRLLCSRPEELRIVLMGRDAAAAMDAFQKEMSRAVRNGPGEETRYLAQLPRLAAKIALGLWAGHEGGSGSLTAERAGEAIEIAKMNHSSRKAILQIHAKVVVQADFETDCRRVLDRIAISGGSTARDLCRKFYQAKLEWLLPILRHLVDTHQIVKLPDDKFALPEGAVDKLRLVSA